MKTTYDEATGLDQVRGACDTVATARRGSRIAEPHGVAFLLSDNAAAAFCGLSRATLWRRVDDQTLPKPIKVGGRTLWRRDELLAAIDRLTIERDGRGA